VGRVELVERVHAALFPDLRFRFARERSEPPDPPRRLKRAVSGMPNRAREAGERRRQLLQPLSLETVLEQRLVVGTEVVALSLLGRQPDAADTTKGVACKLSKPLEIPLGEAPERSSWLRTQIVSRLGVGHRTPAQREATVAPARAACDLPRLVQAHPHPAVGELQRAGAPRHARADDDRIGSPGQRPARRSRRGLVEPVRGGHGSPHR
jgi:hypothetical protein